MQSLTYFKLKILRKVSYFFYKTYNFRQNHVIFRNKAYERSGEHDIRVSGGKVLTAGMEKNVRFVGNSWEQAVPIVQIDGKIFLM